MSSGNDEISAVRARLTEEPIDMAVIEDLRSLGDDSLVDEVVQLYVDDSPGRLAAMREAIAASDPAALARAAHSLKSSSGNVGARHVRDLCAAIEHIGRSGTIERAAEALELLESEYARATEALQSLRPS